MAQDFHRAPGGTARTSPSTPQMQTWSQNDAHSKRRGDGDHRQTNADITVAGDLTMQDVGGVMSETTT